jgi:uncharacterized protein with von Willebrand factor type A (vWA) domain
MDDIDAVLGALHGDKQHVLKEQLRSIEKEIVERRLINADTAIQVNEEVQELGSEIENLRPAHENAHDVERKDRLVLERERLDLTKELREDQRDGWKDVQMLKREEREVENELLGNDQRHKRTKDLL